MRERTAIFGELTRAQINHIAEAFDGRRAHVRGELRIAVDGQTFLEAQLEPIAAGDAVAGPIVKILMGDDRFDPLEIAVCGGFGRGKHARAVEDIEALVLHRAHVEIVNGDNVENVQIVFASVDLFVPAHRADQRFHPEGAFVFIRSRAHVDV